MEPQDSAQNLLTQELIVSTASPTASLSAFLNNGSSISSTNLKTTVAVESMPFNLN